jgi:hypothetical protein
MSQQGNTPGATLQSEWIRLLNECSLQYQLKNYYGAYMVLLDLQTSLPEECHKSTEKEFNKILIAFKKIEDNVNLTYSTSLAKMRLRSEVRDFLRDSVLPLKRAIHVSLETTKWISKPSGYGGIDANAEFTEL